MENIRLIIWDLDETFWKGTLSETTISIPEKNIEIINTLTDRGIMNSICSKNDFDEVRETLEKNNIWDLFVFPKISWSPKGEQVKKIIEQVQLRPESILFIDDNPNNLAEVKFYNPSINVSGIEIIDGILDNPKFLGKNDTNHSRLKQYKILESKWIDQQNAVSNEEFLYSSNIKVDIKHDCEKHIDRITELINRTNQLNFTKNRLSTTQVEELISNNEQECGYITVKDNYGDYGIVGFYSLCNNTLNTFCFSCRILGLGVEQYVYAQLEYPEIVLKGKTVSELKKDFCPEWINLSLETLALSPAADSPSSKEKVSLVGGCDLKSVAFYLKGKNIELNTLFNYDYDEFIIHREDTEILRGSLEYDDKTKEELVKELPFYDNNIFNNIVFDQDVDVLIFSPLIDYSLGVYQSKSNKNVVFVYDNGQKPIDKSDKRLSAETVDEIYSKYSYRGIITPERLYDNLVFIRSKLNPKTMMIVLNGSEQDIYYPDEINMVEIHRSLNRSVARLCSE